MPLVRFAAEWERLAAARHHLVDVAAFEQWVYASPTLEAAVGDVAYLDLLSFDYRHPGAASELTRLIDRIYAVERPGGFARDVAAWTARAFLIGDIDLPTAARVLARLWASGHTWVPSEFAYIDSELDDIPLPAQYSLWEPAALRAKLAEAGPRLREFQRAAVEVARSLLIALESSGAAG